MIVGHEFWKQLAVEHGIQDDGSKFIDFDSNGARDDIFFYETDNHHYVPRNMMIDLEPRVDY
jgi:tubulin gamma